MSWYLTLEDNSTGLWREIRASSAVRLCPASSYQHLQLQPFEVAINYHNCLAKCWQFITIFTYELFQNCSVVLFRIQKQIFLCDLYFFCDMRNLILISFQCCLSFCIFMQNLSSYLWLSDTNILKQFCLYSHFFCGVSTMITILVRMHEWVPVNAVTVWGTSKATQTINNRQSHKFATDSPAVQAN